jgi:hypothetical protein
MKILSDKEYKELRRQAASYQFLYQHFHWFSEYKAVHELLKVFVSGYAPYGISEARDVFRKNLLDQFIYKSDHEIILKQCLILKDKPNNFETTETYHSMRKKLNDAIETIESFKKSQGILNAK